MEGKLVTKLRIEREREEIINVRHKCLVTAAYFYFAKFLTYPLIHVLGYISNILPYNNDLTIPKALIGSNLLFNPKSKQN